MAGRTAAARPLDVRKGDTVVVLTGKDAGKRGEVERVVRNPVTLEAVAGGRDKGRQGGTWKRVSPRGDAVVVQGLNVAKRHTKPRPRQGRTERQPRIQQGGIIEKAMPIAASNVMVVCPECGQPTRVRHGRVADHSVRLCARCGSPLTKPGKP